jgi:hypothetical protein
MIAICFNIANVWGANGVPEGFKIMPPDSVQLEPAKPAGRVGKARLTSLDSLDRRTVAYRETRKLINEIEGDLGGSDRLSTGERQLVQRAAVLGAVLTDTESRWIEGEPIDTTAYCTVVNAQRRVLETIGLRRQPRDVTPSLAEYLAASEADASE